ncbi:RNA-binding protein 24-B-like [Phoenix dactylifera]|uniref:RNA-binding protein 24-B-like n=1 Tax=Phoenix dactylifera TaxID=42345 RepID=A0A8B8ZLK2_PHODC|nr:RNA-binding protein 24-B-like [Phoenix dactylifera]XP_038975100.1 RNA-binding protein 24-B-like [Phoenix dactylifera]XP_038979010.1 RNA-binding protein 24-B-like [Phoenix dactylifera]XP_038979011.1 RNA-binding protein 24-B-like [Phoenix dactylifera]
MAAQPRQFQMGGGHAGGGDTTYTKIFVGGLAWETQRDTMHRYFEQFGEILEAVVITDKNTGRSKGYGFVTFKDPDSATRACQDRSPVIDGRRANCNLASTGTTHRTRPPNSQHGMAGRFRPVIGPSIAASMYHGSAATTSYFHQPAQYVYPYSVYGYSGGHSQESMYPMSYYSLYGGSGGQQHHQFSPYYAAAGPGSFQNFYPFYAQFSQDSQAQSGYGLHYPQMLQYPRLPQQYRAGILSMHPSTELTTGVTATAAVGSSSLQQLPGNTSAQKPSS